MLLLFYLLLMLRVGRCTDNQTFDAKTVGVGDEVKLTCKSKSLKGLSWIRLVSGKVPQVLGRSFTFHSADARIQTSQESGAFSLHIQETKLSDTGIYCCMRTEDNLVFLNRTDLKVVGSTSNTTAVSPSDPVRPTHSVPLQSSVFPDSNNKICPEDHSACLFRCRSHESHHNFNNIQGFSVEEHEKKSEGLSVRNCISSFFKNISSSHAGNCYCAVATCGEKFCGKRTTLSREAVNESEPKDKILLYLLFAAFVISLIIIGLLLCLVKKLMEKSFSHFSAAVAPKTISPTEGLGYSGEQTDENSVVYSAPAFL